jgi:hypothetical protein
MPNGVKWLPAPPEPNSTQFAYDLGGKQVNEEPHTGVYIQSGKKYVRTARKDFQHFE